MTKTVKSILQVYTVKPHVEIVIEQLHVTWPFLNGIHIELSHCIRWPNIFDNVSYANHDGITHKLILFKGQICNGINTRPSSSLVFYGKLLQHIILIGQNAARIMA